MRVDEQITACLCGEIHHDALPAAVQSAIRLPVYRLACKVLAASPRGREALAASIPPTIIDQVKAEVSRLHTLRKNPYHIT